MGWVLTADDQLIEVPGASARIGEEVLHGGLVPGILVGRGGGPTTAPAQDLAALVPNRAELQELIRNARQLGRGLTRHRKFAEHFHSHKGLLERALGKTYSKDRTGEDAFLKDLGDLIVTAKLNPVGIVTLAKNQRMAFAYQGRVNISNLTAVVFPSGEWNTLLTSNIGRASRFFYQMRFDSRFPFPFMALNARGGLARQFL